MRTSRIERTVERIEREGLDGLLVSSLPNAFYLSGFTGSTAQLLLTASARWFITDFRYHARMQDEVDSSYELFDNTGKKLVEEVLPELARRSGLVRIGFESEHVTHSVFTKLAEAEGVEFVPTKGWTEELRQVKDDGELELIRESVRLNERIFTEVLEVIGPGTTERDVAAEIHYRALKHGAAGVGFSPIVATGLNSSMPHATFTAGQLVPGAPLTIDMGVKLNGYCSDMTRTVFFKECPPRWAEIYGIVREAKDLAFAALKPGLTGREVDAVAREFIAAAGHGEHFGHGLGHGVGVEVHEAPALSQRGEAVLQTGNVVTDEPGIYLPGEGGIRIEDMCVVTESGAKNLNSLDTEITVVG